MHRSGTTMPVLVADPATEVSNVVLAGAVVVMVPPQVGCAASYGEDGPGGAESSPRGAVSRRRPRPRGRARPGAGSPRRATRGPRRRCCAAEPPGATDRTPDTGGSEPARPGRPR